jgi:Uma2 family endonuclease
VEKKKDAYLTIPSLSVYVLLEQDAAVAIVYRRTEQGFVREVYEGREAIISLFEIDIDLPLAEIYDGVDFVPEREADDGAG